MARILRSLLFVSCLSASAAAQVQSFTPITSSGQVWNADRSVGEGPGILLGPLELHPGISGEVGYDSNWYQRAGSAVDDREAGPRIDAFRLRVTPTISLSTLRRRLELAEDATPPAPRPVEFDLNANLSYNELLATTPALADQMARERNLSGAGGATLQFLRGRMLSGTVGAGYGYIYEAANMPGQFGAFDRHVINIGGAVHYQPGGGSFQWDVLTYRSGLTFFASPIFAVGDNGDHNLGSSGRWLFLPKTAMVFDANLGFIRYASPDLNSGVNTAARLGLNGLLLTRLGVLVMAGWATSFRENTNGLPRSYDDLIVKAELRYYLAAGGQLPEGVNPIGVSSISVGYDRSFNNSYLGDFFQRDRGYAGVNWSFAQRFVMALDGGVSGISYPDLIYDDVRQGSFSEVRFDAQGFVEYRPIPSIGVNLTARYDQNFSRVITGATVADDLSYSRFRGFLGVRWFL
jgi:hypothetical protein